MNDENTRYGSAPLLQQLDPGRLPDGEHEIWTSPEGVRLSLEVRGGKVKRWSARDRNGAPVPISFRRRRAPALGAPAPQVEVCFVCFPSPLPTGPRLLCYEIPCS